MRLKHIVISAVAVTIRRVSVFVWSFTISE